VARWVTGEAISRPPTPAGTGAGSSPAAGKRKGCGGMEAATLSAAYREPADSAFLAFVSFAGISVCLLALPLCACHAARRYSRAGVTA